MKRHRTGITGLCLPPSHPHLSSFPNCWLHGACVSRASSWERRASNRPLRLRPASPSHVSPLCLSHLSLLAGTDKSFHLARLPFCASPTRRSPFSPQLKAVVSLPALLTAASTSGWLQATDPRECSPPPMGLRRPADSPQLAPQRGEGHPHPSRPLPGFQKAPADGEEGAVKLQRLIFPLLPSHITSLL